MTGYGDLWFMAIEKKKWGGGSRVNDGEFRARARVYSKSWKLDIMEPVHTYKQCVYHDSQVPFHLHTHTHMRLHTYTYYGVPNPLGIPFPWFATVIRYMKNVDCKYLAHTHTRPDSGFISCIFSLSCRSSSALSRFVVLILFVMNECPEEDLNIIYIYLWTLRDGVVVGPRRPVCKSSPSFTG